MICPCLCCGSQGHVHLDCLNQWRATSQAAAAQCSVCKYAYRFRRPVWAKIITNPAIVMLVALAILVLAAVGTGNLLELATSYGMIPRLFGLRCLRIVGWSDEKPLECSSDALRWAVQSKPSDKMTLSAQTSTVASSLRDLRGKGFFAGTVQSRLHLLGLFLRCHDISAGMVRGPLLGYVALGVSMLIAFSIASLSCEGNNLIGALVVTYMLFKFAEDSGTWVIWILVGHYYLLCAMHSKMMEYGQHAAERWFQDEILNAHHPLAEHAMLSKKMVG